MSRHFRRALGSSLTVLFAVVLLLPALGMADTLPSVLQEETLYSNLILGTRDTAGDIVLCDTAPCDATHPANWSDVLVAYNASKGPYVPDSTQDADTVFIFSGDESLSTFLANSTGLSSNAGFFLENPSGSTVIGNVTINSDEGSVTPEPSSLMLLGSGLLGLSGMLRKFRAGR